MKLVVFDLDTALCQSSTMEGYALCQAVADLTHSTVSADLPETVHPFTTAVTRLLGRTPNSEEQAYLRSRFRLHLKRQSLMHHQAISPNPSVIDRMHDLMRSRNVLVGLVSSSCSQVLALKARNLGLVVDAMPCACKDDGDSLDDILRTLKLRAARSFGVNFEQALLIAESGWQEAAARMMMEWQSPDDFMSQSVLIRTPQDPALVN